MKLHNLVKSLTLGTCLFSITFVQPSESSKDNAQKRQIFRGPFLTRSFTGNDNTPPLGKNAFTSNTTGNRNTAIGTNSLAANVSSNDNTAVGAFSLENSTGSNNIALGKDSGINLTTGDDNILIGNDGVDGESAAIRIGSDGTQTTAYLAGVYNVTTTSPTTQLVVVSDDNQLGTTADPSFNDVCVQDVLLVNTIAPENACAEDDSGTTTFNGNVEVKKDITADQNINLPTTSSSSVGVIKVNSSPFIHSFGTNNTFVGSSAGNFTLSGGNNTAVGYQAFTSGSTGIRNTAIGYQALTAGTTGVNNIAIGYQAGSNITSGNNNIDIGTPAPTNESNTIRLGATGVQGACYVAGISGVTTNLSDSIPVLVASDGQLGTISSSEIYKKNIKGMGRISEKLMSLHPVTFQYKSRPDTAPLEFGLIAEEVAQSFPELVVNNHNNKPETVRYHLLPTLLLNEYQQQQKKLDKVDQQLNEVINELLPHTQGNYEQRLNQIETLLNEVLKKAS